MDGKDSQQLAQDKKQLIIDAAFEVLGEKGMAKTSIKEIAAQAGITPGLVHYHFKNKDELLAAVVRSMSAKIGKNWQRLRESEPNASFMDIAFNALETQVSVNEKLYRARFELYAAAMQNDAIRPEIVKVLTQARKGMAISFAKSGFDNTKDHEPLASILYACLDGLAMQAIVDPKFDLSEAVLLMKRMLTGIKVS